MQHASTSLVVETHGLTKRFGETTAVDHVDLRVPRGVAFGYLGPNGAGKTTLIRMLLGLTRASAGEMRLLGHPVPAEHSQALRRVGAIVEEPRFHGHMTGRQNLWAIAAAREAAAHALIEPALDRVGLSARGDDRVSAYSMGMRQRLGIAACLLADPELLLLDEPMNGLDPAGMLELRELLRSFVDEGRTVVLSSHLLDEVEKTCDAVAIVDGGRIVAQGTLAELRTGATRRLIVATNDNLWARETINSVPGVATVAQRDGVIELDLAPTVSAGDTAALVVRRLVDAGLAVHRVEPVEPSLEERFLQITTRLGEHA